MTLWFALAILTAAAVFAVLWPLGRSVGVTSGTDVAVYRDQLDEIERDRAGRRIGEPEANAARVEVSRRLIAAAEMQQSLGSTVASTTARRRMLAAVTLLVLPFGALASYLALGSPALPDQPLAARLAAAHGNQPVDRLIAQVEAHLAHNPSDGRGWEVIAPVYVRLGRFDDAVTARRNALRLNEPTAEREAALGEALMFAANGVVTAEAKDAFERALALDSDNAQAQYFLGLAAEQDGERARAAAMWRSLIERGPADAPWMEFVRDALARVEGQAAPSGPSAEQMASMAELTPEQRAATIRGMVARLADRLGRDGSDLEGWLRLLRSYMVLGETDKARAAVGEARRALASEPDKLRQLEEVVKGLGLEG